MSNYKKEPSSFRDPSGFIFYDADVLYRQINKSYKEDYDQLMSSGLYKKLIESNYILSHEEIDKPSYDNNVYKIIRPEHISFISYPYEWSFTQLKQAALTTLEIQKIAMTYDMTLKDCSAYNIQFRGYKPCLIDTLSFEKYVEGQTWNAYRQFCQHFMAPLALMCHKDIRLNQLLRIYIDGIPLDLASSLLPSKTRAMFSILTHIHAHAKSQKKYEGKYENVKKRKMGKRSFEGLVESLRSGVSKMTWKLTDTEWGDYYSNTNYSDESFSHKKLVINDYIAKIKPKMVWDLGANTGVFSRLASQQEISTISFDIDPAAVEKNYLDCMNNDIKNILPLVMDLTNPSPYLGWENNERMSFMKRGPVDLLLALALVHHLAISNNVPFERIAQFLQKICKSLIIEFVPKTDSQVQRLLATREDIFDNYDKKNFEDTFKKYFDIVESVAIKNSERYVYYMKNVTLSN